MTVVAVVIAIWACMRKLSKRSRGRGGQVEDVRSSTSQNEHDVHGDTPNAQLAASLGEL